MTQKSTPNLLLTIENKLSSTGGTGTAVTPDELYRLFQLPLSPEINLTLLDALEQGSLDPDVTMLQILPHADNNNYLIPLALCIRGGANVNMYVDAPKIGVIHLLAYVYFLLGDPRDNNPVVNTIAALLVAAGAQTSQSVYDRSRKRGLVGSLPSSPQELQSPRNSQVLSPGGIRSLREPLPPLSAESRLSSVGSPNFGSPNDMNFSPASFRQTPARVSFAPEEVTNLPRFSERSPRFSPDNRLSPVGSLPQTSLFSPTPLSPTYRSSPNQLITVSDWLANQKYRSLIAGVESVQELAKRVPPETMMMISILLDAPQLASRAYREEDLYLAIRAFSIVVFPKIPTPNLRTGVDYTSLLTAVSSFNSTAFNNLLDRGQMPSYLLINRLITDLKRYQGRLPFVELQAMLTSSLNHGAMLDQDQYTVVGTLGQGTLSMVTQAYDEPYWRKACRVPEGPVPEELRSLANSLNLNSDMGKAGLCENLSLLSAADKGALKDAARRKQQLRMMGEVGYLSEFLEGKMPDLVPQNRSLLPQDPFTYNENDIVFYRDDQGAIWAFGREMFSTILETKMNPYSSAPVPPEVLAKIEMKSKTRSNRTMSFDQAIDHLDDKDTVGTTMSSEVVKQYVNLANRVGVPSEVALGLSKAEMSAGLRAINFDTNLEGLTTSHALTTTAYIIVWAGANSPNLVRIFFQSIGRRSK